MTSHENIIDVTEASFEFDVIQRSYEIPVVVDFWAPWCAPCRTLGPILEGLAVDPAYEFILAKINVDDNPGISIRFQVQGIPAVKAFRDGIVAAEFVGAQPAAKVVEFVKKLAPSPVENALREAKSMLVTRHWKEAEAAYRDILDEYPSETKAMINLACALLARGEGCEAVEFLKKCEDDQTFVRAERLRPFANYLCETSSNDFLADDLPPIEIQYRQTARLFERGNLEAALDGLMDVLRQDKRYRNGEVKRVLLGIFELLGDEDPLTQSYRRELASVLY